MTDLSDKKYIAYAINLAKKNLGITSPNPVVGCVIVKDNQIISTGVTSKNGRPHAEKIAIDSLLSKENGKQLLANATIYVTLEPCAHVGKTNPCVNEIIKNKISRVVIACQDPDERVNGKSIKKLSESGIEVTLDIMQKESQELNKGFFKAKQTGLPYVTLKLATSLDGKIATKTFDSKWITSQEARRFSHHLRRINDAIMVGSNTIRHDNPMLNCRIEGLEEYSPQRVIVAGDIHFDEKLEIFQSAKTIPTTILTYEQDSDFKRLEDLGVKIICCPKENGHINLRSGLQKLCESGINSVIVEGGQNLATQCLKHNLVDELIWIRSSKIIGNDGISGVGNMDMLLMKDIINHFYKEDNRQLLDDVIEVYRKR